MPIHGHTKIELTSQTTGEVETIEKDNIVTNAVSQIFNAFNGMALLREANANGEYGSTSDKSWELLESLYGGILLYDTALGSDPNTLFAPPEANLVGSGVPKVLNNGKGLQRGSFNTTESKTDLENGVVTFVYDFATSQANGTIASVCLTSRYGGFFGESETALPAADGSNTSSYYNSALFGQETIFPNAPGQNDRHLYGRPLYADPENDEMVFGAISNNKLVLRYATALTTEIDLFNPINTTRVKKTEERDLSDFLQVDHFSYCAVSYDVDADKICVVSTPRRRPAEDHRPDPRAHLRPQDPGGKNLRLHQPHRRDAGGQRGRHLAGAAQYRPSAGWLPVHGRVHHLARGQGGAVF